MWRHFQTVIEGDAFDLNGINPWTYASNGWQSTGEHAQVSDPTHRQDYRMPVYRITVDGRTVEFAAGEHSANVWGFYVRK